MQAVRVLRSTMDRSGSHPGAFAIVQAAAIDDMRMKPAALRMLLALGIYRDAEGWCWPKQKQLAARLGITQQAVSKALRDLADWGYIEIHDQYNEATGARISSRYRLIMDFILPVEHRRTPQPDVVTPQLEIVTPTISDVVAPTSPGLWPPQPPEVVAIEQPKITTQDNNPKEPEATPQTATAATSDQSKILRGLSLEAREILDWHRQCHGRRQPAKLNPESARVLEDAVADLGVARLRESVSYMAGKIPAVPELSKAISAAKTKRTKDETDTYSRTSANGTHKPKSGPSWAEVAPTMGGAARRGGPQDKTDGR